MLPAELVRIRPMVEDAARAFVSRGVTFLSALVDDPGVPYAESVHAVQARLGISATAVLSICHGFAGKRYPRDFPPDFDAQVHVDLEGLSLGSEMRNMHRRPSVQP